MNVIVTGVKRAVTVLVILSFNCHTATNPPELQGPGTAQTPLPIPPVHLVEGPPPQV